MSLINAKNLSIRMILTLLQTEYPNSFANMDERTMALKIELWEREFEEDDINIVYAAVRLYMKKPERFAPSIGQIRENMNALTKSGTQELSDQDAWALVSKACANGIHHSKEEFDRLPLDVQRAVGGPEQLKAWGMMDAETVESVIASNFKRTYRATLERQKQLDMFPAGMREMFSSIAQNLSIEGRGQKQFEAPREKLVPVELKPMTFQPPMGMLSLLPATERKEAYTPLSSEEWEERRDELMKKLTKNKEVTQ